MLSLKAVTRHYGEVVAIEGISFDVHRGEMVGFVGANGAGKTTTMRIIMGVLAATSGSVLFDGAQIRREQQSRFGYMPEERGLYPKQKVLDQLIYLGQLHGLSAQRAKRDAMTHLERLGLAERAAAKLETLSLGNQQRVQVIAAVMADPIALVLDEPFSGLDPTAVDDMVALLREHAARGVPLLFSSHQLDLVERLCDRVVVLTRGRVVADGTPDRLRSTGTDRYRLSAGTDLGWLRDVATPGVHVLDVDGASAVLEPDDHRALQPVLAEALRRGEVTELTLIRPSLSDIYREVTA